MLFRDLSTSKTRTPHLSGHFLLFQWCTNCIEVEPTSNHPFLASVHLSPLPSPPPPPPPHTHTPDTRLQDFTPRLFELSSTTGEFVASEVLYSARDTGIEAAPFLQSDLYSATQPGIVLYLFRTCIMCLF